MKAKCSVCDEIKINIVTNRAHNISIVKSKISIIFKKFNPYRR